ncbi:MAG: aminotransferase class V-fold PLP-dependent enzyme [Candidatus Bathyarchaeia archaeon]|nr:aminotransferase class V-fold PLP-dependent enzyme [Candidatus Bathyarchaeota archaeon]
MRLSETASRFEVGTPSTVSFIGAAEAVKLLLNFGIENIEKQVLKLTDYLIEKIRLLD